MNTLREVLGELQKRRFPAILAIYCAGGFAVLEVIDDLSGRVNWPNEIFNSALALLLIGLLNVGIAAWFHGAARSQRCERREILLHLVPVLIAATIVVSLVRPDSIEKKVLDPGRIQFQGFTTETTGGHDGDSLTADITRMLTGTTRLRIERADTGGPASVLAGRIVTGSGRMRISVELSDAETGIQLWSGAFDRDSSLSANERQQIAATITSFVTQNIEKHFRQE